MNYKKFRNEQPFDSLRSLRVFFSFFLPRLKVAGQGTPIEKNREKGFVIMIALITSTIVLSIAIGVLSISLKDFIFSGYTLSSTQAIFAADAGIDCALYYTFNGGSGGGLFPVPDGKTSVLSDPVLNGSQIKCAGETIDNNVVPDSIKVGKGEAGNKKFYKTTFKLKTNLCAEITVTNYVDDNGTYNVYDSNGSLTTDKSEDDTAWTVIESKGWSSVDRGTNDRCNQDLSRRTERSLELTFGKAPTP